jgi:N-acetylglucosamine-6-sulfatase
MPRLLRIVLLLLLLAGGLIAGGLTSSGNRETGHAAVVRQNIVLILTDDQRWDSLQYMPNVESQLMARGVSFTNAFDNNPLCCPTRATIMTGLTSGHNGVWWNADAPPIGGAFAGFTHNGDQNRQIFGWLHASGYTTALVGKFLNGYHVNGVSWRMPGVDDWQAFAGVDDTPAQVEGTGCNAGGYWNTCYSNNGVLEHPAAGAYSTTTSGDKAVSFIQSADPQKPLFLYYAPRAPHGPTTPEPKYAAACGNVRPINAPSLYRQIVNGPGYMEALAPTSAAEQAFAQGVWIKDCQTLLSVDDQVARIIGALTSTGRLHNTLIVFASDNGLLLDEHRWRGKIVPYDESIRVPIVIRDDARIPGNLDGSTISDMVSSLDYTQTFLDAAGVARSGLDGESMLPLATGGNGWETQAAVLIEHAGGPQVPAYCGVRTASAMFTQYATGEYELYDLRSDPYEMFNVAHDPRYGSLLLSLRAQAQSLCVPTPAGFSWNAASTLSGGGSP